jgi:hypothetical protein
MTFFSLHGGYVVPFPILGTLKHLAFLLVVVSIRLDDYPLHRYFLVDMSIDIFACLDDCFLHH